MEATIRVLSSEELAQNEERYVALLKEKDALMEKANRCRSLHTLEPVATRIQAVVAEIEALKLAQNRYYGFEVED